VTREWESEQRRHEIKNRRAKQNDDENGKAPKTVTLKTLGKPGLFKEDHMMKGARKDHGGIT